MIVTGRYKFSFTFCNMFNNTNIEIINKNLITKLGESYFLNRWINDKFETINYICVGTGTKKPQKMDIQLGAEKLRVPCNASVDLNELQVVIDYNFEVSQIMNITEIGIVANEILICRDVFNPINIENGLENITSNINLEYILSVESGAYRKDWERVLDYPKVYSIAEPNNVSIVYDEDSGNGYGKQTSFENVVEKKGTWYWNNNTNRLFIHTYDEENPNGKSIVVKTR